MKKKIFYFLIIVVIQFSYFAFGAIPAEERAALIALYNGANGNAWTNNSGWKNAPLHTDGFALPGTEGTWYGVTVSGDNVIKLTLDSNNLSGVLPSQIGNLGKLKNLDVRDNQLQGNIPPELGNLGNLEELHFWNNRLSGSIPPALGNLKNLVYLDLCDNKLSGEIPPEFGNLTNISHLSIYGNQLTGNIPTQLANLSNLTVLCLRNNQLSGAIPSQLGNLSKLQMLILNNNQLSGNIPPELGNLSNLEYISLGFNNLSGSIPPQLSNLSNLTYLILYANQLSGYIPSQLGNLSKLIYLNLFGNQLTGSIPPELGNLSNLKCLILSNNQLIGSIPSQLGNLSNLDRIYLHYNQLTGSIPPEFGNFSNMTQLSLNNNQLSGNIPPQLGKLKNLGAFWLQGNQLSGSIPSELGNLNKLKYLYLNSNRLNGSIPPQLGNLNKLNKLYLDNNQLSGAIPPELGNLSDLGVLWLGHNQLSGSIPPELGNLSNLIILRLNSNQLSGDIPSSLKNINKLYELLLDNNYLGGKVPANFSDLSQMSVLDIRYNCLSATDAWIRTYLKNFDPDWEAHQDRCVGKTSKISINLSKLNFDFNITGSIPNTQTVSISNSGSGVFNWNTSSNAPWLSAGPSSGVGASTISVSVNPAGLALGNYTGAILITDTQATNSPQPITVSLNVKNSAPFGDFATPTDGSSANNSIPVTGWALDDKGVANVKIYNGETYIGDAVFVEGARPDVAAAYPTYPNNNKAGWGYMLLTYFLPNGGNGTYKLIAKATDTEGNVVTLGSKTITIDNAHAVKPFGAIDTPTQGGTASGKNFVNYGWALTPRPNMIPVDGSTINVLIDGVNKGHPKYNIYRADIASLFPGYANKGGAIGYYTIDATKLSNGIHTIAWTVSDNAGNSDGIGSRYFSVTNTQAKDYSSVLDDRRISQIKKPTKKILTMEPVDEYLPAEDAVETIKIKELERVEISLPGKGIASQTAKIEGYLLLGGQLRELPIGSTLDKERGVFYWQPGPGFLGTYSLVFILTDANGQSIEKPVDIKIEPKFTRK